MSIEADDTARPKARDLETIFSDLQTLAQGEGALHGISSIMYRDWAVAIDVQEGKVADDVEKRWSTTKLNNNELMLLLGLMVQSSSDRVYSVIAPGNEFEQTADELLRELHDRLVLDFVPPLENLSTAGQKLGVIAREAIYYGADSFYLHQLERFARHRYRADSEWLIWNVGIAVRPMLEIARFILERISLQITAINEMRKGGTEASKAYLTNSLLITKDDLAREFGSKVAAFISKFSTPATNANAEFTSPFIINQVNLAPLIDLGDYLYVPNSYRLFEIIYESPFYWMMDDPTYSDTEAKHRGEFLERTATHLFCSVFGKTNVHQNVTIHRNKKEIAGEADTLVIYGEFVIIVQAKSKRVTLKARSGDERALSEDFEGAIQHPYRQAYEFAELVEAGAECKTKDGKTLVLPPIVRAFPAVVLSDTFPSATFLSNIMLKRSETIAPVIWDLGILDSVARMLPTPIEFIYYLKCRSDVFDRIRSDSEYNFLGYHLKHKLAMPPDVDFVMLDRDFAGIVDDFMVPQDMGIEVVRPPWDT